MTEEELLLKINRLINSKPYIKSKFKMMTEVEDGFRDYVRVSYTTEPNNRLFMLRDFKQGRFIEINRDRSTGLWEASWKE